MASASALLEPVQHLRHHLATSLNLSPSDIYYNLIEASFLALAVYLALTRAYKPWARSSTPVLTEAQVAAKLQQWKPQPLAPSTPNPDTLPLDLSIQHTTPGKLIVNGQSDVLDFATCNFLGLLKDPLVEERCLQTMKVYGCGACGPRGFYGTTDVHLECEDKLATFSGTETAILYSFGAATGSSTIPALCKRGDLVVCDEGVNFTLMAGVQLSRAEVRWFKHNDMDDLERVLKEVWEGDKKNKSLRKTQRRLILVEGVYQNYGDLCPLDKVVELKNKYLFRVMLDESFSLGVLGKGGKGSLEHFGVERDHVEIATADLGNALAAVGGYCVGGYEVVNHQRLSGAGYCFSASQPPFLATAATVGLEILEQKGAVLVGRLRANISAFRNELGDVEKHGWYVDGDNVSPVMYVRNLEDVGSAVFRKIQERCLEDGVLIARPMYSKLEPKKPSEGVRITVSAAHSKEQVVKAGKVVREVLMSVKEQS